MLRGAYPGRTRGQQEVTGDARSPATRLKSRSLWPQLQEAATRRTERVRISRFMSVPVAATRCPSYSRSFSVFVGSTSSIDDERFFRNPDLQLRDLGASTPDVSRSQNVSSSSFRHPVIVTGPGSGTSALAVDSTAAGFNVDSTAGFWAADFAAGTFTGSTAGVFSTGTPAVKVLTAALVAGAFETIVFLGSGRDGIGACSTSARASGGATALATSAR